MARPKTLVETLRKVIADDVVVKMYETMSMTKVGHKLGINRNNIPAILRRCGAHIRTKKEWVGELGGHWKGGKAYSSSGYIYTMKPDHPLATTHGYVMEHRLVMEKKLRRYLTRQEIVHHINGDPKDNRPENLDVQTRSVHVHNHFAKGKKVMAMEEENRILEACVKSFEERIRKLEDEVKQLKSPFLGDKPVYLGEEGTA